EAKPELEIEGELQLQTAIQLQTKAGHADVQLESVTRVEIKQGLVQAQVDGQSVVTIQFNVNLLVSIQRSTGRRVDQQVGARLAQHVPDDLLNGILDRLGRTAAIGSNGRAQVSQESFAEILDKVSRPGQAVADQRQLDRGHGVV